MSAERNKNELIEAHGTLIPIGDIPKLLPRRSTGKRLHISACYRWITRGVRGIRLEVVRIGGGTYTSHEALARFTNALSPKDDELSSTVRVKRNRQQQIEQARTRLQDLLR